MRKWFDIDNAITAKQAAALVDEPCKTAVAHDAGGAKISVGDE